MFKVITLMDLSHLQVSLAEKFWALNYGLDNLAWAI